MKRLFHLGLVVVLLGTSLVPQFAWAKPARHHAQHHRVRHVKRHHPHRTGA